MLLSIYRAELSPSRHSEVGGRRSEVGGRRSEGMSCICAGIPYGVVCCLSQANVPDMFRGMTLSRQESGQSRRQLCINEKAHRLCRLQNGVIEARGSIRQRRLNVGRLEIREIGQDDFIADTVSQQIKNIADANAHPANAGTSPALIGIDRDPVSITHRKSPLFRIGSIEEGLEPAWRDYASSGGTVASLDFTADTKSLNTRKSSKHLP